MATTPLRRVIMLNAALSLVSGLVLAAVPATVGSWLGVDADGAVRGVGVVLILHGLVLGWVLTRDDVTGWARLNIAAIAPYPVIVLALVAFDVISATGGKVLAVADAGIVAALAIAQTRRIDVSRESRGVPTR